MKKLFIFVVLFLMVFSTFAIADNDDRNNGREDDINLELRDKGDVEDNGIIDDSGDVKDNLIVRKRMTSRLQEAREKLSEAKEKYMKVKERYAEKIKNLEKVKEKYGECQNSDTEDCKLRIKDTKTYAKEHLINSADLIIEKLNELKTKTESSEDLTEEEANEMIATLDEKISEIEEAKSTLESLNEDSSKEEIKEAADTIKTAWNKINLHMYKIRVRNVGAMMNNLITKAEIYGDRIELKASELNSDELNSLLSDYNSQVENARQKYEMAKEKWQAATTPQEIDDARKEVNQYLKEANESLKQSREKLREMISMLKQNDSEISLDIEEVQE